MDLLAPYLWAALALPACAQAVHRLRLLTVYLRTRRDAPVRPPLPPEAPHVTVQLPVFNERDVVGRLIDAVGALDWPPERLQVQLLDDSTDDTGERAEDALARLRARGIAVEVLRRTERRGYKAGALAAGLPRARGGLVAVFDADFVPGPTFLRETVPWFADPSVSMVQARWGHLNDGASLLTAAQSVLLDGHFVIEHAARHRGGHWFNFNGTGGVWRRAAIDAAGGWQSDTLTEDIDLSYRAQLGGARFVYLPDAVVPAELPDTMDAFRAQQARWAKGTTEVLRKLGWRVLRADASIGTRLEALAHLGANLAWLPTVTMAVLLPVAVLTRDPAMEALPWLSGALLAVNAVFYGAAVGVRRGWQVPLALVLAVGISVGQATAVLSALRGRRSAFVRTPKRGAGSGSYAPPLAEGRGLELAVLTLNAVAMTFGASIGAWNALPVLLLFVTGLGWTATGRRPRPPTPPPRTA